MAATAALSAVTFAGAALAQNGVAPAATPAFLDIENDNSLVLELLMKKATQCPASTTDPATLPKGQEPERNTSFPVTMLDMMLLYGTDYMGTGFNHYFSLRTDIYPAFLPIDEILPSTKFAFSESIPNNNNGNRLYSIRDNETKKRINFNSGKLWPLSIPVSWVEMTDANARHTKPVQPGQARAMESVVLRHAVIDPFDQSIVHDYISILHPVEAVWGNKQGKPGLRSLVFKNVADVAPHLLLTWHPREKVRFVLQERLRLQYPITASQCSEEACARSEATPVHKIFRSHYVMYLPENSFQPINWEQLQVFQSPRSSFSTPLFNATPRPLLCAKLAELSRKARIARANARPVSGAAPSAALPPRAVEDYLFELYDLYTRKYPSQVFGQKLNQGETKYQSYHINRWYNRDKHIIVEEGF